MQLPTTKAELLTHIHQAYSKLDGELAAVDRDRERLGTLQGNVSCCDVIAYQIGWGQQLLRWDAEEKQGKKPEMPSPDFKWNQLGALAQSFYDRESEKSLSQLRTEFAALVEDILTWVTKLDEETLFQPGQRRWTGEKWPLVKWIQVNTVAPYGSARTRIRRWKKEQQR